MRKPTKDPTAARLHYAWVVVLSGLFMALVSGTVSFTFGIFLVPIAEDLGWGRGLISMAYALQFISIAFFSVGAGWMSDRFGARRSLVFASVLLGASLILSGSIRHLWQLYLYRGLLTGAAMSVFVVPLHTAVGLWFRKKLGVAIGLVTAGMGVGPLVFSPLIRYLITHFGWGGTFIIMGIGGGAITLVAAALFRSQPSDMGLLAYGEEPSSSSLRDTAQAHRGVFYYEGNAAGFFKYARSTQPFTLLILIHLLGCVSHAIPIAHVVAMATDGGIPAMAAASLLGIASGFAIISRFGTAVLADRVGGKRAVALALFIQATSILMLLVAQDLWMYYLFAFVFGLGYGGEMVCFPILNRQYYGSAPTGQVYGYQMLGAGLGMAAGGYLGGLLFDLMGGYTGAIWLAVITGYLGLVLTLMLVSPLRRVERGEALAPPLSR